MEYEIITPQERLNLAKALVNNARNKSDETLLDLGLVRNIKQDEITYSIVDKNKWLLAKIKYGL